MQRRGLPAMHSTVTCHPFDRLGFRVQGFMVTFRVQGLGVWGLGFRVLWLLLGFRVQAFRVQGLGFYGYFQGLGFRHLGSRVQGFMVTCDAFYGHLRWIRCFAYQSQSCTQGLVHQTKPYPQSCTQGLVHQTPTQGLVHQTPNRTRRVQFILSPEP